MSNLRFAFRQLLKNPGFTTVVVLTLALGIGATTAIYSVISVVILNPVPGREPDRLIQIGERSHGNKDEPMFGGLTSVAVEALKLRTDLFADAVSMESLYLEGKTVDFIEGIGGTAVSPNFFAQWNIKPILGRTFARDEAARLTERRTLDRETVVVLSYSLWQSRFGGNRNILGTLIELDGNRFTVIGVMPRHFQFPSGASPTFWIPVENTTPQEISANIRMFVRLKPGVSVAQTQAMLDTLAQQLLHDDPSVYDTEWRRRGRGFGFLTRPLRHEFTQTRYGAVELQRTLWGLLAAIGFVLLIACVNVANLMLARTEMRQQELAIRAAIGAGRARLARQLLTESGLLAGGGALAGLAFTVWGMQALILLIPENLPRLRPIYVDGHVLAFTLLISMGTVVVFGLVPALQAGRTALGNALKRTGTGATIGVPWRRYRSTLVIAEVALALVLLTGAGLMLKSVANLLRAHPGFDSENLLLAHPGLLRGEKYAASRNHSALFDELHQRFAALPGVKAVGVAKLSGFRLGFTIDGHDKPIGLLRAGTGVGESDLFRAMRIPLLAGRHFDATDIGEPAGTVIVNETMARLCWPGEEALNKTFRDNQKAVYRVVGVVGDARIGLRGRSVDQVEPTFYRPYYEQAHTGGYGPFFVVRTHNDPQNLIPAVRDTIKSVETSMTTPWFQVARQTLYDATQAERMYMLYLVVFAFVGLLLAALGIHGVLAYSVGRRTREIGIRLAVGAQPHQVQGMVMAEGGRLVGVGIGVGLVASYGLTRLLRNQLFEVSPTEPGVLVCVATFLLAVSMLACLLPARRAARINPLEAIRTE